MKVRLSKEFHFEASHRLTHLPESHPCFRLHGHSYRVEIELSGEVNSTTGFLVDYAEIKDAVDPLIGQLDHRHLNDIDGLAMPTTEYIAKWIWDRLKVNLPTLLRVTIRETASTRCDYYGE